MKKERQSSRQGPIQLSANKKSHSISLKTKQQPLFAPYKIDWKTPSHDNILFSANQLVPMKQPFKNIENSTANSPFGSNLNSNTNSKLFYKNMKNQLLNIKQDVEKSILKEKKTSNPSVEHMNTTNDEHSLIDCQNSNGCIKTINIKNKCQQKSNKHESPYENVDKIMASKISDAGSVSSKFTIGQSKHEHLTMHNFIEDQIKNTSNFEAKYRSEKDSYMRTKSKSIAESFSKGFALDLINARQETRQNNKISVASSLKFLQNQDPQNQEEQLTQRNQHVKHKMEVEIKLPSFEKTKICQFHEEKNNLIHTLQSQLNDLEKELSLRDQLISRKQQCKFQLAQEIENIKKQLQSQKHSNQSKLIKYEEQINNLRNINQQNQGRARFYEEELQKAIHVVRQKEQQTLSLMQNVNNQANTIQELSTACEKLSAHNRQMKQSVEQSRSIKEKMKLKDNQVYIYQEQLKEAKLKIKQLKESVLIPIPSKKSDQSYKPLEEQQMALEESSKMSWQLKECRKLNQNIKTQNQRLKKEFHSINGLNTQNQSKIAQLINENSQLKIKINQFEKNSRNAIQELINSANFQGLGNEISKKLSQMVDENYQLKNKVSRLQSSLQELTLKNSSLTEQLQIHQETTYSMKDCTRRLKIEDWDNLTEERDHLKSQIETVKDRFEETKEFYELETMKKENQIHELKQQIEQMIEIEVQNEKSFHPNVRSVKHIKNLNVLLSEFKDMIEYNLELKQEIGNMKK